MPPLQEAALADAYPPRPAMGPWDIPDGKRMWMTLTKRYGMTYSEAAQQLDMQLGFMGPSDYKVGAAGVEPVLRAPHACPHACPHALLFVAQAWLLRAHLACPPPHPTLPTPTPKPCAVNPFRCSQVVVGDGAAPMAVTRVQLSTDRESLSAEVDGRLMRASLMLAGTQREQALTLWVDGAAHEFRCGWVAWCVVGPESADAARMALLGV